MKSETTRLITKTSAPRGEEDVKALFGIGLEDELPPDDDSTIMIDPAKITATFSLTEKQGEYIGRYCLKSVLGEGGFGMVWLAEQHEPIRREVALKVIKAGMDSKDIIARFDAERQALALMDHPNIAGVLDAGATQTGRPFFVMELVRGEPITHYCDKKRLTVRQRLELFIPICQAVQHAHQKAILHRDLKPSNILVTEIDGRPVPMVIDFGIAKALGAEGTGAFSHDLVQTMQGVIIGTPQYMSPEQAGLNDLDVDTRSDIYSLGVILYELLTGETPLPPEVARKSPIDEILRHIREEDAKRPSSRLIHVTEKTRTTAKLRHTQAPRLTQVLKQDLDWIVLRALEKDRDRRYDTATSLMLDIQRYLNDEPVSASPPSVAYRFWKMVRRHRKSMSAAALIVLSLILGLAGTTYALQREKEALAREATERAAAESARAEAETAQQKEAAARATAEQRRLEAETARKTAETERSKAEAAAEAERRAKFIAANARDKAEALIEDMLIDLRGKLIPLRRTALLSDVATSAEKYFKDLPQDSLTDDQWKKRAMTAELRGMILLSRGDTQAAQTKFDEAHAILSRRVAEAPKDAAKSRDLAVASQSIGLSWEQAGRMDQARAAFEQQLKLLGTTKPGGSTLAQHDIAIAHASLARVEQNDKALAKAQTHLAQALDIMRTLRAEQPANAMLQRDYANVLEQQAENQNLSAKLANARESLEEALTIRRNLCQLITADAAMQRQLGVTLERLITTDLTLKQPDQAAKLTEERLGIAISLAKADPLDVELQNDLLSAHDTTAAVHEARQQWPQVIEHLQTMNRLLRTSPAEAAGERLAATLFRSARARLSLGEAAQINPAGRELSEAAALCESCPPSAAVSALKNSIHTALSALKKAGWQP